MASVDNPPFGVLPPFQSRHSLHLPPIVFWLAVSLLFVVVNISVHHIQGTLVDFFYSTVQPYVDPDLAPTDRAKASDVLTKSIIIPAKKVGFLVATGLLLMPIVSAMRSNRPVRNTGLIVRRVTSTLGIFGAVAALCLPLGSRGLGLAYARMSISPFDESLGLYYRRLLMPAIGNTIGFSGFILYFVLSLVVTFVLMHALLWWCESRGIHLSFLQTLSFMTSSVVIFHFQFPGYPEQLAFLLIMVSITAPLTVQGRAALAALTLATHESSALLLVALAIFMSTNEERMYILAVVGMYLLFFLVSNFSNITGILESHLRMGGDKTIYERIADRPLLLIAGVLVSFKLLWLAWGYAAFRMVRENPGRNVARLLGMTLVPLLILPFVLDVSRFAGFALIGVLVAMHFLNERNLLQSPFVRRIFWLNLAVPSFYVGLDWGVVFQPGLYQLVYEWLPRSLT